MSKRDVHNSENQIKNILEPQ